MKYLVIILIIMLCALVDFITGYIKAYVHNEVKSQVMRIGGAHKLCEIVVIIFVSALGVGFDELAKLYPTADFARVCGIVGVGGSFVYMLIMELISICENLYSIFPEAHLLKVICKKLRIFKEEFDDDKDRD